MSPVGGGVRLIPIDPLWLAIVISVVLTLVAVFLRVWVMQRFRAETTRVNRQQSERLKFMVAAYRSLAGSFTPATADERHQVEAALSDVILFGTREQVQMATACATALLSGQPPPFDPLVASLRDYLRIELGLDALPAELSVPPLGPSRYSPRGERGGGGRGGGVD